MRRTLGLALLLSVAGIPAAPAAETGLPDAGAATAAIDAYMAPLVDAGQISGSVRVARGKDVLYERSFGLANRELSVPVDGRTRFCVASVTKPMTLIIAIGLVEAGTLSPTDPLSKWLPDFPRGEEIDIRMLLAHRAGIAHRVTTDAQEAAPHTAASVTELAKEAELLFSPGSAEAYSSAGYSVLARVLEVASGKTYGELLERMVFAKAGMTDSAHPAGHQIVPNRASSYAMSSSGEIVNSPLRSYSFLVGAGSVFSTPRDLHRLLQAVVDGAFGERVRNNLVRESGIAWNGRTDGYRAFADYHSESGVFVTFAGNLLTGAADHMRRDLPKVAAGEDVTPPVVPAHRAAAVAPDVLRRYAGEYDLQGTSLALTVSGDEVRMSGWLLIPTSTTSFFSPQDWGEIAVVLSEDGSVEGLRWAVPGSEPFFLPRVNPEASEAD